LDVHQNFTVKNMKTITTISDTHTKHHRIKSDLIGGDFLLHGGDIMSSGYNKEEVIDFLEWFDSLDNYTYKIFIAGNHDRFIENNYEEFKEILKNYKNVIYLQDEEVIIDGIKIYGSPWQPWFWDWAFNLPRNSTELHIKWNMIPDDTDILLTHTPPMGVLDYVPRSFEHVGCEALRARVFDLKPKLNIFGHIHEGSGNKNIEGIEFINASVLNENYMYTNKPLNLKFSKDKGVIEYF